MAAVVVPMPSGSKFIHRNHKDLDWKQLGRTIAIVQLTPYQIRMGLCKGGWKNEFTLLASHDLDPDAKLQATIIDHITDFLRGLEHLPGVIAVIADGAVERSGIKIALRGAPDQPKVELDLPCEVIQEAVEKAVNHDTHILLLPWNAAVAAGVVIDGGNIVGPDNKQFNPLDFTDLTILYFGSHGSAVGSIMGNFAEPSYLNHLPLNLQPSQDELAQSMRAAGLQVTLGDYCSSQGLVRLTQMMTARDETMGQEFESLLKKVGPQQHAAVIVECAQSQYPLAAVCGEALAVTLERYRALIDVLRLGLHPIVVAGELPRLAHPQFGFTEFGGGRDQSAYLPPTDSAIYQHTSQVEVYCVQPEGREASEPGIVGASAMAFNYQDWLMGRYKS